jgi:hypothetical protein
MRVLSLVQIIDLLTMAAAGALIGLMVLVAGRYMAEPVVVPAAILLHDSGEALPKHDEPDWVVETRRRAAAREIERQWHTSASDDVGTPGNGSPP